MPADRTALLALAERVERLTGPDREADAMARPTPDATCWLIWSGEHRAWWRPDARGYCEFLAGAGRYTFEEAAQITEHCGPEKKIDLVPDPYGVDCLVQPEAVAAALRARAGDE